MFQVALCEDEKIFAETQEQLCRDILGGMNIEYGISVFESGTEFLTAFINGGRYDLILLDIVMDGLNGVELAKKIREADKQADIVFVTSNREYAIDGYGVKALHYLTKPVDAGLLESLIKEVYGNKYQINYFILKSGTQTQRIAVKDIIALETIGRKVEITTTAKTSYYTGKLTELLNELPPGCFIRCHQAFAIGIGNIREIDRFEVVAVNGKRIPVSRSYMKDVQTAFLMKMQER